LFHVMTHFKLHCIYDAEWHEYFELWTVNNVGKKIGYGLFQDTISALHSKEKSPQNSQSLDWDQTWQLKNINQKC
jgi:hypothetical protein